METTPIFIVRADGRVEDLGTWVHEERRLELTRAGFPFLGPGVHVIEGDLPWLFWDMCPSGFMGARFARQFPELALPERPQLWSAEHALRALCERGEDLTGNLLVGHGSRRRYGELAESTQRGMQVMLDFRALHEELARDASSMGSSSVGGERPKLVLHGFGAPGQERWDVIAKYSPPVGTPAGRRWKNLLTVEALVGQVLRGFGLPSALGEMATVSDRAFLVSRRFDRSRSHGRVGAATFAWLAASRGQAELSAPDVARSLHRDGLVEATVAGVVDQVHAFSSAIGNTDAHLGNYGLLFDDTGRATLAPIYDVSPMVFAPRFDELPDPYVRPRTAPIRDDVRPWVETLVELARASDQLDRDFLELWLRYVGA